MAEPSAMPNPPGGGSGVLGTLGRRSLFRSKAAIKIDSSDLVVLKTRLKEANVEAVKLAATLKGMPGGAGGVSGGGVNGGGASFGGAAAGARPGAPQPANTPAVPAVPTAGTPNGGGFVNRTEEPSSPLQRVAPFARPALFGATALLAGAAAMNRKVDARFESFLPSDIARQRMMINGGTANFSSLNDISRYVAGEDNRPSSMVRTAQSVQDLYAGQSYLTGRFGQTGSRTERAAQNAIGAFAGMPGVSNEMAGQYVSDVSNPLVSNRMRGMLGVNTQPGGETANPFAMAAQLSRSLSVNGRGLSMQALSNNRAGSRLNTALMTVTGGNEQLASDLQMNMQVQAQFTQNGGRGTFDPLNERHRGIANLDESLERGLEDRLARGVGNSEDQQRRSAHGLVNAEETLGNIEEVLHDINKNLEANLGPLSMVLGRLGGPIGGAFQAAGGGQMMEMMMLRSLMGGGGGAAGAGAAGAGGLLGRVGGMGALAKGGLAAAGGSLIGAGLNAMIGPPKEGGRDVGGILQSTATMAGTGAMIGSIIPGLGTGIGAAIGGGLGFLSGMMGDNRDDANQRGGTAGAVASGGQGANANMDAYLLARTGAGAIAQSGTASVTRLQPDVKQKLYNMMLERPSLSITTGWRSSAHQTSLFTGRYRAPYPGAPMSEWKHVSGPVTAVPGTSNHEYGLAVDMGFAGMSPGAFRALAQKHGFQFNVSSENWHIEPGDSASTRARRNQLKNTGMDSSAAAAGIAGATGGAGAPAAATGVSSAVGAFANRPGSNRPDSILLSLLGAMPSAGGGGSHESSGTVAGAATGGSADPLAALAGAGSAAIASGPGGAMSIADIARVAVAAGLPRDKVIDAVSIALAESGGKPSAHNPNAATGDNSYGLWQINMLGGMGPERRRQFGLSSNEDLLNPALNAKAMMGISSGGSRWSPWSTWPRLAGTHTEQVRQALSQQATQGSQAVPGQATAPVGDSVDPAVAGRGGSMHVNVAGSRGGVSIVNHFTVSVADTGPQSADAFVRQVAEKLASQKDRIAARMGIG